MSNYDAWPYDTTYQAYPAAPAPQPQHAAAPKATAEPRKPRRWPWIVGILAAFIFGNLSGHASSTGTTPATASSAPAAAAPTYEQPTYEQPTYQLSAPTGEASPAPAAPQAPAGTITNGTYEIGTEVEPGKYKSPGPESGLISLCYVDVQRGDDFLLQEVSNDGQVRVEIKPSWKGALMEVSGCQPLVKVG